MAKPTEIYPSTDRLAACLYEMQERERRSWMGYPRDRGDVPRLLAVAGTLAANHKSMLGRCATCYDETGQRVRWPCAEYLTIADALVGDGEPGDRPAC